MKKKNCPDRKNDQQIIAEIARRKAMKTTVEETNEEIHWEGEITDVSFYVEDLSSVQRIEKLHQNRYKAVIEHKL